MVTKMELGTGIFLSAILISFVLLFRATKDRWNWKKIFGYPAILMLVAGVGGGGWWYYTEMIPKPSTSAKDVELGTTYSDVIFKKGKPTNEEVDEDGEKKLEYPGLQVMINTEGVVENIWIWGDNCWDFSGNNFSACSGGKELLERFGPPDEVENSEDLTTRLYTFNRYNFKVGVTKDEVVMAAVFNPDTSRGFGFAKGDEEDSNED